MLMYVNLNIESCHPASLHAAWPVAYLNRLWVRSSSLEIFRVAKDEFIANLRRYQTPEDVLGWIDNMTCFTRPFSAVHKVGRNKVADVIWQPMKFNPLSSTVLSSTMRKFLTSHRSITMLQNAFERPCKIDVRFAWQLPGSCFGSSLIAW